jgi:hypothetical protein
MKQASGASKPGLKASKKKFFSAGTTAFRLPPPLLPGLVEN